MTTVGPKNWIIFNIIRVNLYKLLLDFCVLSLIWVYFRLKILEQLLS